MKRLAFIFLIFLAAGYSAHGQNKTITEFDLYGCWTLESNENGQPPQKWIYKSCEESDSKLAVRNSKIRFLAYSKCEFQEITPSQIICPGIWKTLEGTWSYDEVSGLVEIFYPENYMVEFWKKLKEEHPDLVIPNPRLKKKFRVVGLNDGQLEIEKTTHNITYSK
ncbi:hypothetical protein FK220_019725 [Flavobacteriaceae bacterium TP-CH-4]|uniref:Lipocalin-like domain-containing protein n=2 Tax=Pelagihabitans pacificus TaxID=2696054 RepID=A0A967E7G8_9FLAO|nr:hypothetical protein [Pelagihabitans pacificus]